MLREAILLRLSNRKSIPIISEIFINEVGSLKASLIELGLTFDARPTWNICDMEYKALHGQLKKSNISDLTEKPFDREATTILIGAVLTEAVSAAFWSDVLLVRNTF